MNKLQTFQEFLATQSTQVPVVGFIIDLCFATILAFVLKSLYVKYGSSLSNRRRFGDNFVLITMTTMVVIAVVKSSLALSLGLVGALSIVRFRAAIKDPEELAYLFVSIAIGLGFGANQRLITFVSVVGICLVIILYKRNQKKEIYKDTFLTISSNKPTKVTLEQLLAILEKHCISVDLKRFDESADVFEGSFFVELSSVKDLTIIKSSLYHLSSNLRISFLDSKGVL